MDEDLDENGAPEHLVLTSGHLKITTADKVVWQSPEEWNVVQAEFTDLNRDGAMEATLLVWRPSIPGRWINGFHMEDALLVFMMRMDIPVRSSWSAGETGNIAKNGPGRRWSTR